MISAFGAFDRRPGRKTRARLVRRDARRANTVVSHGDAPPRPAEMSTGELNGHSRFARREPAASCGSGMDARVWRQLAVVVPSIAHPGPVGHGCRCTDGTRQGLQLDGMPHIKGAAITDTSRWRRSRRVLIRPAYVDSSDTAESDPCGSEASFVDQSSMRNRAVHRSSPRLGPIRSNDAPRPAPERLTLRRC